MIYWTMDITKRTAEYLLYDISQTPKFHLLPKIHKPLISPKGRGIVRIGKWQPDRKHTTICEFFPLPSCHKIKIEYPWHVRFTTKISCTRCNTVDPCDSQAAHFWVIHIHVQRDRQASFWVLGVSSSSHISVNIRPELGRYAREKPSEANYCSSLQISGCHHMLTCTKIFIKG